ncbi:membrane protein [Microbacterium phage Naby]|uniref:Membrane protein n=1 Tax=Microbacterium phage BonaeVitae TaxID=2126925 RepID=A0A2R3ZZK6_9CAUD|nr:holin [Microbacterium phage BonaeVitae]AVR56169.1 membrane protein [Microbacterium phage BonaeVitae]QFG10661.1 membrane protein [Microbacterium phage Naby]
MSETNTKPLTRRERRQQLRAASARWITPALRRWAYGVAGAAVLAGVGFGWLPAGAAALLLPLAAALFYVDETGEPR